jgi:hypothetical protein
MAAARATDWILGLAAGEDVAVDSRIAICDKLAPYEPSS